MKQLIAVMIFLVLTGCEGNFEKIPEEQFVGQWELNGRSMFDGIRISIELQDNKLIGRINKLNENKFINMFCEIDDIWISDISRNSNFQFRLTEKKIAGQLFSIYGLSTSSEYKVEFIDENTIGLATNNQDPQKSKITYKRIE